MSYAEMSLQRSLTFGFYCLITYDSLVDCYVDMVMLPQWTIFLKTPQ